MGQKLLFEERENELLSEADVKRRTDIAKMRQLELSVENEYLKLLEKSNNLCRIDRALEAFNEFLSEFVDTIKAIPDRMQSMVKNLSPEEYKDIEGFIDEQLQRLAQKRLYMSIESTASEKALASRTVEESRARNQKLKKGGK